MIAPAEASSPQPAVVLAEAAIISPDGMPPIDTAAQPWSSDAAGLAIEPPVVVGAEPWVRPQLRSVAPAPDQTPDLAPDAVPALGAPVPAPEERP